MLHANLPHRAAGKILDFLLPPLCLSCDAPTGASHALCPECWSSIHFITAPYCACCGAPFEAPVGDGMLCAACIASPPVFAAARAAMLYDDASRHLVVAFKHDRIHSVRALAAWMARAGQELLAGADLLVPVPLHRWRLFKRRYNQAALLAHELAAHAQKPMLVDALLRVKPTPTQGHMKRKERQANVKGAFGVPDRARGRIKDKTVLLIDDVLTTGATVNECSQALLDAGARAVNVLTLARVKGFL